MNLPGLDLSYFWQLEIGLVIHISIVLKESNR
jgi:hypothetical protein